MTKLLLRLFVKDAQNPDSPAVRLAVGKLAGVVGILCNALLCLGKVLAGVFSGSVALVADGVNNLSDAASSVVTLLGFRMAQQPADADHPYGHARYEYISGLVVAALILVIGADLAQSSVGKILHPQPVDTSPVVFGVLIVAILGKLWMSRFFAGLGRHIQSTTLQATSVDSRNDVISSAAVLAGCLVEHFAHLTVDGYVGLVVAVFILWSGVGIARETISPLLGQGADRGLAEKISALILSHEKVLGLHDLLVHDYGPGQCFASVHVEMSAQEDPLACHDLIDEIECQVLEALHVHLVIHYDPVVEDDAEWNAMRQAVEGVVAAVSPRLSVHDFRLVRGAKQTKMVFDLAVPYDMTDQRPALKKQIEEALAQQHGEYLTVIRLDGKA
ncbi:cation diffusion facilitator family transporter [Evtepia sp.]|uniref:cation diffusion facilitator family transporter n=1 Tax=Evtepia sp. TaxID=2773933 RepID=UPI003999D985